MAKVKELPHDLLAEKSLLGCLLIDGSAFDDISDLSLQKDDFYSPRYGAVYDAIKELALANQPIDFVTVSSFLLDQGNLEEIGLIPSKHSQVSVQLFSY